MTTVNISDFYGSFFVYLKRSLECIELYSPPMQNPDTAIKIL